MRALTTLFEAEKNKKTGAASVLILKCPFVAGTLYLSDRVFTYTGITIKPWIASWGSIDEDLSNQLSMPIVSDFSVDIIIDPNEATDIHDLLWSEAVETINCELYLWFEGLTVATDPMKLIWTGNIIDFERISELVYNVRLVDESVKIDKHPGRVLSLVDYPNASLNDIGYQMPIIYGSVNRVPGVRIYMGRLTTLAEEALATDFSFIVSDSSGFTVGDIVRIENEQVQIKGIIGNMITCNRGYNTPGTGAFVDLVTPDALLMNGMCAAPNGDVYVCRNTGDIYKQTGGVGDFVALSQTSRHWYDMCAAPNGDIYCAVQKSGAVDGDIYKQTGGVGDFVALSQTSRYWQGMAAAPNGDIYANEAGGDIYKQTGGVGDFVALSQTSRNWRGMAAAPNGDIYAVVAPGKIYKQAGGVGDFNLEFDNIKSWYGICIAPNGNVYAADVTVTTGRLWIQTAGIGDFVITTVITQGWNSLAAGPSGNIYGANYSSSGVFMQTGTAAPHVWGSVFQVDNIDCIFMFADHPVKSIDHVYLIDQNGVEIEITASSDTYTGQGGANDLAGYEGKAVVAYEVDYTIGDTVLITGDGYQDDGTFGGGAGDLIERPDHIFKHFLFTYAAWPKVDFSTDAAASFDTDSYVFSMVLNARKSMKEWLAYMALQCRCWFRFAGGKAYLLYRPDSISSDKTIAKFIDNEDDITTMKISRSPLDEVVNVIHLYYQRDWSLFAGREAYQAVTRAINQDSIDAYGEKEKADTFLFDFIRDSTMAADLRDFYLARYKDRKKVISGSLYLDHCEIEFADGVTLTEAGALLCEVRKAGMFPGNANTMDTMNLIAREY